MQRIQSEMNKLETAQSLNLQLKFAELLKQDKPRKEPVANSQQIQPRTIEVTRRKKKLQPVASWKC